MKGDAFAVARRRQESFKLPGASESLASETLGQCSQCNRLDAGLDLSGLSGFFDMRLVFEPQIKRGQSGRCVSQGGELGDGSRQNDAVHT